MFATGESAYLHGTQSTSNRAQARADNINKVVVAASPEVKPTVKSEEMSSSEFKAEVETSKVWVKIHSIKLHDKHKEMILNGSKLNDLVINAAQL